MISLSGSLISDGEEKESVRQLVIDKVINNWEAQDNPIHLKIIRYRILKDEKHTGKLLEIYQIILKNQEVNADNSFEMMKLQLSGLVVKQDNKLKVYNPIYKAIFNENWVYNQLDFQRPKLYAEKFSAWIDSNQLDDNQLLNKEELYNAQEWAADKSLSNHDYKFISASLDLQRKKAEKEAEETLANAKKKAKSQLLIGIFALLGILSIGGTIGVQIISRQVRLLNFQINTNLQRRISTGEDILLNPNLDKRAGAQFFTNEIFEQAAHKFRKSLENEPNDPEALIYWNNAKFANSDSISIAVGVPIGKNKEVAQEMLRGVAQAQNEVNKNCEIQPISNDCGINGRPLQVKIVNDDNDPEIAQELARRLVKDRDVLAVIGHNASDVSLSVIEIYQDRLVMISPTSTVMDLTTIQNSKVNYIFRTVPGIRDIVEELVTQIATQFNDNDPKILLCYDSDADANQSFKNELDRLHNEKKQNFELINTVECDFSNSNLDYELTINEAIEQEANSLLLVPHIDRIHEAIELAKINNHRLKLFSSPSLYTSKTLEYEYRKKAVEGMQMAVYWHPETDIEHYFSSDAKELWREDLNYTIVTWRTAMAYDATQAIIKGLKQITEDLKQEPTRQGLQKALSDETNFFFDGATGRVGFKDGERIQKEEFFVEIIKRVEDSEIDFNFVPIPDIER